MARYFFALDIGGTKTSAAIFDENGSILEDYVHTVASKTFEGAEEVYRNTKNTVIELLDKFSLSIGDIEAIGVGSPGPLTRETGVIINAPLMGWKNFPLVNKLKKDFLVPVLLDNDANLGALAEQRCGVAQGKRNVIYMTVSTGCGGGMVIDGKIYHGKRDMALEIGHMSLDINGENCPCGGKGCFELYASGTAINMRMRDRLKDKSNESILLKNVKEVDSLTGKELFIAAQNGDVFAIKQYEEEGVYLGVGIANLFNLFDPDILVLGGGVTKAKDFFHEKMMETINSRAIQFVSEERIRYSKLNDRVVLYGAYYLMSQWGN